ncbi:MAG: ABC transporter permease [Acidobacteriota bacterium]
MSHRLGLLAARIRGTLRRKRNAADLEDEFELHLQMLADRMIQQGMELENAAAAARRQFGNSTLLREQHYTQSTFAFLTTLWRDVRFGARQLQRNPLLTFVGVTSLALGVGANTAIFAGAKRVLFDTLPVKQPHELRMLTWVSGRKQIVPPVWGDVAPNDHGGLTSNAFSYPVLQELRKRADAVQDFIAFKDVTMTATVDGHPEIADVEMISGDAFRALGVGPARGRLLLSSDDAGSASPVAVISQGYWAERFGRSPSVLGKEILLNGAPVTIVGVTAGRFAGLQMGTAEKIFVPLTMQPLLMPRAQNGSVSLLDNPQSWWLQILVRLRPDVSEARAQSELDATLRNAAMPALSQSAERDQFHLKMEEGDRGLDYLRIIYAAPSYLLLALAGLILLLACVNLANLLLARSTSRQREMSTRIALGASPKSILRQVLTESVLLSSLGGAVGLLFGYLVRNAIPNLLENAQGGDRVHVGFNWTVVLFTLGISLAAGLLFGLAPAWQATRCAVHAGLRDSGSVSANRRRMLLDKSLVIGQIALSAILLVAAGLFAHTLLNLNRIPLGFQADHILLFRLNLPRARYNDAHMTRFFSQLQEKLASLPGVRSETVSSIGIVGDGHSGSTFRVLGGAQEKDPVRVQTVGVGVDFFQTLHIPILQGRAFNRNDTATSPKVAVVNRALARKFFPNENAIGRTFEADQEDVAGPIEIVGIATDTGYAELREKTPPIFYVPYVQNVNGPGRMMVELRTAAAPGSVLPEVRAAVESLDRDLPLMDVRTMKQQVRSTFANEQALAQLTGCFSLLALALACIGIYGIMAYTVTARTGEIGLRIALGATAIQVIGRILREALWLAGFGIIVGLTAALWLARFIGAMLYGLGIADPLTLGATACLLITVSLLAAFAPARRASHIDPIRALRHE